MKPITTLDELTDECLQWRGIMPGEECRTCGGTGWLTYGSTATFWGGIGGAALTSDACNKCWGSGMRDQPWPDRRKARLPASGKE
jgi:hypothetical protein